VGSAATDDEGELNQILNDFFDVNYPEERLGVPADPTMEIDGDVINLAVLAQLPTTLMNLVGINVLDVSITSVIIKETQGLEVAMVLDVTGSMSGSKIEALKQASHDFVGILFGEETSYPQLKIGIVPFNTAVNLGTGMISFVKDTGTSRFSPTRWKGCVEARPGGQDVTDSYVESNTANNGRWRAYGWPFTSANPWPAVTATRGPNKNCPDAEVLPITSDRTPLDDRIDDLRAQGNTHVNVGAVWGWRLISPTPPYTQGVAYSAGDFSKAVIIMTNGENVISTSSGQYSSYGTVGEATTKLGCSSQTCKQSRLDQRLLQVFENMKDEGIIVYTVGFDLEGNDDVLEMLEDCATTSRHFFDSPNAEDLQQAFEAIGTALSNLRIGR